MRTQALALGVIAVLLAACGGSGGGSTEAADPVEAGLPGSGKSVGGSESPGVDVVAITAWTPAAPVPGGGSTRIDLVISNPSSSATAATITATLNLGAGLTRGTVSCSAHNGAICPQNPETLTIPSLPAGGRLEFAVTALVESGASGPVTNSASVTATDDSVTVNNTADVVVNTYSADVRVTGDPDSREFFSGSIAKYTMTVSNEGPDAARNLAIENAVGASQTLSSIACVATGATCPPTDTSVITLPELPAGASLTFTVGASIAPSTIGPVSHTMYVRADGDQVSSNNVATSSATARIPVSPQSGSFVALRSDAGDYIGQGHTYDYDRSNALIDVDADGASLSMRITGDQNWSGDFMLPNSQTELAPGTYSNLARYPFHDLAVGGLNWEGEGRGCNALTGTVTIDAVTYVAGSLAQLDLRFEQHCEGRDPTLRGQIHWNADDDTSPPGPVNPPPTGLWSPADGATPTTGNYVYLESDGDDYIGLGGTYAYTQANAALTLSVDGGHVSAYVEGDERWYGEFQVMNSLSELQPGYYGDLQRYPSPHPTTGSMRWTGESRSCTLITGWFVVDRIAFSGTTVVALDLRFEQRCDGHTAALRGEIHWQAGDTTTPDGPQNPPPPSLWTPAPGAGPSSGNYVYLESQPGDYIGQGRSYTFTQANSILEVSEAGAGLEVRITGDEQWTGNFQPMNTLTQLEPGYYGDLMRFPFHNPVAGGMSWSGDHRGCNTLTGWFVVDHISFSAGSLAAIDLRFEQHCEGNGPALYGKIHWAYGDPTQPPGPERPPPSDLWAPPADAIPANLNYMYLESDAGDFVGGGYTYQDRTFTYTSADTRFLVTVSNARLSVSVIGDESWSGTFAGMQTLAQLESGYYGDLQRWPFNNPVKGGLDWSGEGRGCNRLTGWFVIDDVTYADGTLDAIDLRFEQRCDGGGAALHGALHWDANDPTRPPGPQDPPPPGLWKPASGAAPSSGNYVYLQSDSGDFVGAGETYSFTPVDSAITVNGPGRHLSIAIDDESHDWTGEFEAMNSVDELQPGYYGDLQRYPFHNPAKGGLSWYGDARGCNVLSGWFVVDNVTYSAGVLASIDLRFEQHCEGFEPALHGEIHWIQ